MYEAREQEDILAELQEASTTPASKIEGTFENDVLASNSIEFAKTEVELEEAYRQAFGTTATGEYLTMRAAESGVLRKEAVQAIGELTVTGSGTISAGSLFATESGIRFQAVTDTVINKSGTISIIAVDAGASGNVAEGLITSISMSIPGISKVTNENPTHDGYDEEDDDALRERYLLHVRYPGTSGNPRHYQEWAMSVSGVGAAKCQRAWNGPDTVRVIIVDSNYEAASTDLAQKVYDYIESVRPINAILTVTAASPKLINITASVTGTVDTDVYKTKLKQYFSSIEQKSVQLSSSHYVSYAYIGSLLLAAGAEDYTGLTVNDGTSNIVLADDEVAVLGTVTLNG